MKQLSLPKHSPLLSKDFTFGVATASFQIEGGAAVVCHVFGTPFVLKTIKLPITQMV
jgi:hypothetical protein